MNHMREHVVRGFMLLLAVALLLSGISCAKAGEKTEDGSTERPETDLFERSLSSKLEHTYRDGDSHSLLTLFPDGRTGFYQSLQPGVLLELRDLETGKVTKIRLGEYHAEDVEAIFRSAVVLSAKSKLAEVVQGITEKEKARPDGDGDEITCRVLARRFRN